VLLLIGWRFVLTPAGSRIFLEVISIKKYIKNAPGEFNWQEELKVSIV